MATDFFDRQDHARRLTTRLLVMFFLSVAAIVLVIYLVAAAMVAAHEPMRYPSAPQPSFWNPQLFAVVALGTLAVILVGSLYKIAELSAGGETVALMLGGRAIDPQTTDLAERRVLNVVEEMALASGVPVPPVFVLDHEPTINAFAAGHQPGDAVVAVSSGCLKYLNREELQGVMGHEFSHILNGDMRLDLRLIGIVNGILVLAIIGYYLMRTAGYSSSSSRDSKGGDSGAGLVFFGLALLVLGYLGVFFGKLIKAAINRQREFLADASAVQFTRSPGGIAGALKKIGGLSGGSRIRDAHAAEVSHMFFGDAFANTFFNLFATHPPLERRIRALEPEFDGQFPEVEPLAAVSEESKPSARARLPIGIPLPTGLPGGTAVPYAVMGLAADTVADAGKSDAENMVRHIGQPQAKHLQHANQMVSGMPPPLLDAAREPFAAQAVIYTLLLSRDDETTRTKQLKAMQEQIALPLYQELQQLADATKTLAAAARLPLVDLTMPALKRLSTQQYQQFRQAIDTLVDADGKVDLFEYCVRIVIFTYLDVHFGLKKPPAVRYRTTIAVALPLAAVLSALAYAGQEQPEEIERAFQAGICGLIPEATLLPREQCALQSLDAALAELAQASPNVKRTVITAVTACIAADGKVTLEEGELLRVVAAVLGCPMPPIVGAMTKD